MRALGLWSLAGLAGLLVGCEEPLIGDVCAPGAARCNENSYEVCADDGLRYVTAKNCSTDGEVCVANAGCLACFPDQTSCGGDGFDILRCTNDGSSNDTVGRCDPETGDLCVGGACQNACEYASESRSYEGCEYWAVDLDNAVVSDTGAAAAQQFSIVVSNPLELPATVTVEVNDSLPGETPVTRTVAEAHLARVVGGGDLAVIDLDPREVDGSTDPRLNDGSGTYLSSNAYRVVSTAPIVAYQFNPLENVDVFSNDASLLLPATALDDQYMVMGWPQTLAMTEDSMTNGSIDLRAFLTVVGTTEETFVSIDLKTAILGSDTIDAAQAGDTIELTLGPFDVLNLESDDFNADFTGTMIYADKPIAVFSGSEASDVPMFETLMTRYCCADHLEEQLFPESAFGTQFVAVKTPLRTMYVEDAGWDVALIPDEEEYWRIMATAEDANVSTTLPAPYDSMFLQRGQYVTFPSERDFLVEADSPISFAQFPVSQQATGIPTITSGGENPPGGDPSFIMVPPIQQWRDKYVFLVPNKYAFDFLLLAVPVGTDILYDDLDLATTLDRCEYEPIGTMAVSNADTEFQAIRCPLSSPAPDDPNDPIYQDDGRHVVESTDGKTFGLVVWGWDQYVSYGYPGGTNVELINPL